MPGEPLDNYIRTFRKQSALTQEELALLAGIGSGVHICSYERGSRVPTLDSALALSAIFGTELRELFAGKFQKVEESVAVRAEALASTLSKNSPDPATARKLATLRALYDSRPSL
jgi:transcriptional regulator with XRE-family HTH domain